MKSRQMTGNVSNVRGHAAIETDFIDECRTDRRTSGMVREDNHVLLITVILLIIMFVTFLVIYKMQTDRIIEVEQKQSDTLEMIQRYS